MIINIKTKEPKITDFANVPTGSLFVTERDWNKLEDKSEEVCMKTELQNSGKNYVYMGSGFLGVRNSECRVVLLKGTMEAELL